MEASATPSPGRDFWRGVGPNRASGSGTFGRNLETEMRAAQAPLPNHGGTALNQRTENVE